MRIVQIVFSPTGGTQRVADLITGAWELPVTQFDLSDPAAGCTELQLDSQDLVLIAVPSFGGRVPALAIQRLSNISGGGARCAVVCVYGNRAYEDTLIELSDAAARCGFEVIAGVAAIAEHSIFHEYATGRPDAQDTARLQDIARRILDKAGRGGSGAPAIPGNHPYKKAGGGGLVPKAESGCTGCGHRPGRPPSDRSPKMHLLYAVRLHLSRFGPQDQQPQGGRRGPGHQKGLPGAQRVRTLHLTGTCYYHRSDWTGSFLCGGCRFWFWGG